MFRNWKELRKTRLKKKHAWYKVYIKACFCSCLHIKSQSNYMIYMCIISYLLLLILRHVAININAAEQGEDKGQRRQAKHLEVDPDILRQPECDIDIRQTTQNKK